MGRLQSDTRRQRFKYLIADYVTANVAWWIFNLARYHAIGHFMFSSLEAYLTSTNVVMGQVLVPLFWLVIYYYSGYYNETAMKSRLVELKTTILSVFYGSVIVFFIVVINDLPKHYMSYYKLGLIMLVLQFMLTYLPRAAITAVQSGKLHGRHKGYATIILGCGSHAREVWQALGSMDISMGYEVKGFVDMGDCTCAVDEKYLAGRSSDLPMIIDRLAIDRIIIAPERLDGDGIAAYLNTVYRYDIPVSLAVDDEYILTHNIPLSTIYAYPLIDVNKDNMPAGQQNVKRTLDIVVSVLTLVILSPLFVFLALKVRHDSPGPVLYRQERLGKGGRPFVIYKFRTMYVGAEQGGPRLATDGDGRITPFGRTMRKYRLDELPQFWNVLTGDMSIVGPRPERRYFAEQIIASAPYYCQIYTVRPGITSWGMVKFGYANDIDQMVKRLQFDIIYLDNRSLLLDMKILIYTVKTIITGKGI